MAPIGRWTPAATAVVEIVVGPTAAASAAGVTGGGTTGTAGVVATGCVHWIGVAVAGLEIVLGAGVEGDATSGIIEGCGESAPARGLRPRLAAVVATPRPRALGVVEAPGVAGMKERSWVNGEAMAHGCVGGVYGFTKLGQVNSFDSNHGRSMARSLYSISPSPGPLSPSFSDDSSSLDGAPSAFVDYHDGTQHPPNSRSGSPTRGGGPPANAAPSPDVVTCQWEDCGAAFDDLSTFIRHLHEGAPRFPQLGFLTPPEAP